MVYNPSLQEEQRNQRTKLISPNQVEPLLHWLDQTGRLIPRGIDAEPDSIGAGELIDEIVDANAYNDDESISLEDD